MILVTHDIDKAILLQNKIIFKKFEIRPNKKNYKSRGLSPL